MVSQAVRVCEAPAAAIALVDESRCWYKARLGLERTQTPVENSLCRHVIGSRSPFIVQDARVDPRFNHHPLVSAEGLCFYAGVPLVNRDGHSLGSLWVADRRPRVLTDIQLAVLQALAGEVVTMLEPRRSGSRSPFEAGGTSSAPGRVLVVDDDELVRSFVGEAARSLGYEVFTAGNGEEALAALDRRPEGIDIVLTDVNMPVMDGIVLARKLKLRPAAPAIAVMSARFEPYMRAALRDEGISLLISKPFSLEELDLLLQQARLVTR
ncbi:MAG: response regulator [Opitutaceae bacterium]|nr:response regulator [Opitutaceae bacterium]